MNTSPLGSISVNHLFYGTSSSILVRGLRVLGLPTVLLACVLSNIRV